MIMRADAQIMQKYYLESAKAQRLQLRYSFWLGVDFPPIHPKGGWV